MKRLLAFAFLASLAISLDARVLSYAPYTDRNATPAYHQRTSRYFVLLESPNGISSFAPYPFGPAPSQAVLYDSQGLEEPRVILPAQENKLLPIWAAALRENAAGVPSILLIVPANYDGSTATGIAAILSVDAGATWKKVAGLQLDSFYATNFYTDFGGPFTRGWGSPIRLGTNGTPFIIGFYGSGVWAIGVDANARMLFPGGNVASGMLLGSDRNGTRFLVHAPNHRLNFVDLNGNITDLGLLDSAASSHEGWITNDGAAYVHEVRGDGTYLFLYQNGDRTFIAGPPNFAPPPIGAPPITSAPGTFFAIPTADYNGAWVIQRATGRPTNFSRHTRTNGLETMWIDVSAPEVEALHAGASGDTVLIQVHRPRQQPERVFKDPALAVWRVGQPAPRAYDELFLNEQLTKGFLHLDVDRIADGEPFVFDSGTATQVLPPNVSPAPPAGGSDVVQEWGVVRASLRQKLILPGVARTAGAFGSFWLTDLIVQNPADEPQNVVLRYVPNGDLPQVALIREKTITLAAREVRVMTDVLKSVFELDAGGGALFITPQFGVAATSRTYTKTEKGTYGYGMNAIDQFAAASPRFGVSFAGAFPGKEFRTNLVMTDTSGRGSNARLAAVGLFGPMGSDDVAFNAPVNGQEQINGIGSRLALTSSDAGGLLVTPTRGSMIASVFAIDNRTNDSTYFPPDLPSPIPRIIPAIGHLDGANNSKFRSDLYLYNSASTPMTVYLQANAWDQSHAGGIGFTLLANEARVIPDALFKLFGMTGIASLRYSSTSSSQGVRVTSRTYAIDENGGTFGFLMPPLNNFQSGTSGETLEILGATGDKKFRTNIGLVELTQSPVNQRNTTRIEIFDDKGAKLDSFTVDVPSAGGLQINDIFRARNLGEPAAAVIRISPTGGLVGAYATVTDNGTNDSIYLAANLAASE